MRDTHVTFTGVTFDLPEYIAEETLGEGSFGVVRKVTNPASKQVVVMKEFKKGFSADVLREIAVLAHVPAHESVVRLIGISYAAKQSDSSLDPLERNLCAPALVQTLYASDLERCLQASPPPPETYSTYAYLQLERGVAHLHKHGFMHRDLKSANVLCNRERLQDGPLDGLRVVVGDLGNATRYIPGRWNELRFGMTLGFSAPETIWKPTPYYTPRIDLWSLGIIYLELLLGPEAGALVFTAETPEQQWYDLRNLFHPFKRDRLRAELAKHHEPDKHDTMLQRLQSTLAWDAMDRRFAMVEDVPPSVSETAFLPPVERSYDVEEIWNGAPELNLQMRAAFCDWLLKLLLYPEGIFPDLGFGSDEYNPPNTDNDVFRIIHASMDLLDRFVATRPTLLARHLQVAGTACFSIMSSLFPVITSGFIVINRVQLANECLGGSCGDCSDPTSRECALQTWECHICRVLEFDLYVPLLPDVFSVTSSDARRRCLPRAVHVALLYLVMHDPRLCQRPYELGQAALDNVHRALTNNEVPWDHVGDTHTSLSKLWNHDQKYKRNSERQPRNPTEWSDHLSNTRLRTPPTTTSSSKAETVPVRDSPRSDATRRATEKEVREHLAILYPEEDNEAGRSLKRPRDDTATR